MAKKQLYWKGEEELLRTKEFLAAQKNEFNEALPLDEVFSENNMGLTANRRDFLKFFGFSVAAVSLAACNSTPVRNIVPYLVKPEEITPGVANYYNSTCGACSTACGTTIKTREGRPIKIDGNVNSPISKGGLCATGQASILGLYDTERLDGPTKDGDNIDWKDLDSEIQTSLNSIASAGGKIAIVSGTIHSPSTLAVINEFKTKYTTANHISYDAVSYSGILSANKDSFGKQVIPSYHFDKANVVVSFGADFLGTWISPVEFTKAWSAKRKVEGSEKVLKTIVFESNLSLTGSNADYRFPMKTSNEAIYVVALYNELAQLSGGSQISMAKTGDLAGGAIKQTAKALWTEKGNAIVVSGSNNPAIQSVINGINILLGNYGNTIDLDNHSNQYKGVDADFVQFSNDLKAGAYQAVIFYNTNPVYNSPLSNVIVEGLKKTKLSVSFSGTKDETATLCQYIAPDHHFLESWNDAEPKAGIYQLSQPTISPVFKTRQAQESLMNWAGVAASLENDPFAKKGIYNQKNEASPYYLYIRKVWATNGVSADDAFNKALHDGGIFTNAPIASTIPSFAISLNNLVSELEKSVGRNNEIDLILYQNIAVKDGAISNNPLVQETPDPISKVTWDNYVSLPKALAENKGIQNGDLVNLTLGSVSLKAMPVFIQPGQSNQTVGLALGYGRKGKIGEKGAFDSIGKNAFPFVSYTNNAFNYVLNGVKIEKISGSYELAQTQTHHSIEGRAIVKETTFNEYKKDPKAGNNQVVPHLYTLWETKDYKKEGAPNHHWAMAIDLNACTGCSACVVSCSVENNVPVVGRAEVRRRREMHWIRIDRYFAFEDKKGLVDKTDSQFEGAFITKEKGLEIADKKAEGSQYEHWENVKVVHQPMMCQHCGQAPCETVCPVLATTHSTEGLNQMTYNRCIGTKYCANNCPYKVRRFNWFRYNDNDKFDFHFNNDLGKMVINPDVTVRTRGVMEKCSMCVQSIQAGKVKAKREKRTLNDGEVKTACQRACPANAIVFGDVNDVNSEVRKLFLNERSYRVLEELNTQTAVKYLTKVRDTENSNA
ncbi:MAG: TAT-variant-translocated molybdopterin oxidoreductase [Bacteroidota bacterium]|nr:TAT-variant-translocated molybdopterin oxidoreductase [Bacteroidota bacterium]